MNVTLSELRAKTNICLGIAGWKRPFFTSVLGGKVSYVALSQWEKAVRACVEQGRQARIICWASSKPLHLEKVCSMLAIELIYVEDGFIRSSGLGIKLNYPASLTFSREGFHYDPKQQSTLETMLLDAEVTDQDRATGRKLLKTLYESRVSKYNLVGGKSVWPTKKTGKKILVIGQVSDDASMVHGAPGIGGNIGLIQRVFNEETARDPHCSIVYRPHPDVSSGQRNGEVPVSITHAMCDFVSTDSDLTTLIDLADEVHVATSQTGLDALVRGKTVVCHGQPFYAGWGLTVDRNPVNRRTRSRTLEELLFITMIEYPVYFDPWTYEESDVFKTIQHIQSGKPWPQAHKVMTTGMKIRRLLGIKVQKKVQIA
jgi:capsular polysaccharide export protein